MILTRRKDEGFTLIEIILVLIFIGVAAAALSQTSTFYWTFTQSTKSMMTRERLNIIKNVVIQSAQDINSDQYYEIYTAGALNTIPAALSFGAIAKDKWGNGMLYCAGTPNSTNISYANNDGVFCPPDKRE